MSLASAVLRPQGLNAPVHGPSRVVDLVVEFVESLMRDPEGARITVEALIASGSEALPAFLLSRQEKMRLSEGRWRQLLGPFAELVTEFLAEMRDGIAETLPAALKALRRAVAMARADNLARLLRDCIHTAQTGLDITPEAVAGLFRQCLEGAVARLQAAVNTGDLSEEALAHYELGLNLRNLEHLILEEMSLPGLDVEGFADALRKLYARKGVEAFLDKAERVLDAAESLAGPLGQLLQTVLEARVSAGGSVGAAANGDGSSGGGSSSVAVDAPVSWYATWVLRREARWAIDESTTSIGPIPAITYNCIKPKGMEQAAFHTLWFFDMVETLLHIISIEQRDIAVNTMNAFWTLFNTVNTPANQWVIPGWLQWAVVTPMTVIGGLETVRCSGGDDACFPITQILGDAGEVILYKRWTWIAREFILSVLTLSNNKPSDFEAWKARMEEEHGSQFRELDSLRERLKEPTLGADGRAEVQSRIHELEPVVNEIRFQMRQGNHNQFHGLCYGIGELGAIVIPAWAAENDRENYGFGPTVGDMFGKAFGGMAVVLGFRGAAMLLGSAMARKFPDDTAGALLTVLLLGNERYLWNPRFDTDGEKAGRILWMIGNFILELVVQGVYRYLFTNGNTSGGTYHGLPIPGINAAFPGNPPAAGSPYLLPWAAPNVLECAQNPMGIWSHYPTSFQAYAYDYNHDAGTEVLCSRPGFVVNLADTGPNNTVTFNTDPYGGTQTGGWNFIEILHMTTVPAGAAGSMPSVPHPQDPNPLNPPAVPVQFATYADGTTGIFTGTRFPPYWDVNGNPWPLLPTFPPYIAAGPYPTNNNALPLHPNQTTFQTVNPTTGLPNPVPTNAGPADLAYALLNPAFDRGYVGVTFPAGTLFAGTATPVPAGVVFPPGTPNPPPPITPMYRAGTTFSIWQARETVTLFTPPPGGGPGVAGFTPAPGALFLDGTPIPAGVILPPDCAATPAWLPAPHPATPLYLPGTTFMPIAPTPLPAAIPFPAPGGAINLTAVSFFNAGTNFVPVGAVPPAINTVYTQFTPVVFTFCQYGHALQNYTQISLSPANNPGQPSRTMVDVFNTNVPLQILGRFIPQGRVLMLSGDTGVSAYNHLHQHVLLDSSASRGRTNVFAPFPVFLATVPFGYADATHGIQHGFREAPDPVPGIPRAMTWYASGNTRTGP